MNREFVRIALEKTLVLEGTVYHEAALIVDEVIKKVYGPSVPAYQQDYNKKRIFLNNIGLSEFTEFRMSFHERPSSYGALND